MTKFTNIVSDHFNLLNEQEPGAAPPVDPAMAGDPAAQAPPAPAPIPDADPAVDQDARSLADLAVAARIALQLKTITPEDRELLLQVPSEENAEVMRELLNSIAGWFDTPKG